MITLATTETLRGVAGSATAITYTISGMELSSGVETYKTLAQGQLANAAGTLYTAPASTVTFIKTIHLANATGSAVSGVILYVNGTAAANQITGSITIPANGWATFDQNGWQVYNATGQVLAQGAQGGTPAIVLATSNVAGNANTFLRTNDQVALFDGTTPVAIAAAGATGTNAFSARSDHTHTIGSGIVTRAMANADEKAWSFIGTATGSTVTIGPVTTAGTFRQFMVYYFISGYAGGTPIGRLLMGPSTPSTTALTNGNNLREAATATAAFTATTAASIPGIPFSVTATAISRAGVVYIDGASGSLKSYQVTGQNGNASVSAPPTQFLATGWFSDLSTNLPLKQFQLTVYDTLVAVAASTNAFTAGTYLSVWGRNTD